MLIDLVSSVAELINRYGLDAVRGTVERAGDHIAAIKLFREITSCSLKEAKDIVETTKW